MKTMNKQDLADVVRGACFLATGGGGAYETGIQLVDCFKPPYYKSPEVEVVTVAQAMALPGVKYAVVAACIGSPERVKTVENAEMNIQAVRKLAELRGIRVEEIGCIVPVEIGAFSSLIACVTAAGMGMPVVDGDGAGRAVPKLNMTTFAVCGVSVNPTVLMGERGDYVALNISGAAEYSASASIESLARPILAMPEFGEMAGLAMWLIDLVELDKVVTIRGTLTKCKNVGSVIREMQENGSGMPTAEKLLHALHEAGYEPGFRACGKLLNASTKTAGGFDHGVVEIEAEGERRLKIIYQNESLLLWDSALAAPAVVAPDLISYLIVPRGKSAGQWVYSNGDLMSADGTLLDELKDADIVVIGMRAPEGLRRCADKLEMMRGGERGNGSASLPDSYRSMLEELNYYGKYEPLEGTIG